MINFGDNLIHLSEVESTNDFALQLLNSSSVQNGTVIVTDSQTKGKGQRGTMWTSSPGQNLTFSIVLNSIKLNPLHQFLLSEMVALAIHNTITHFIGVSEQLKIKWPNDIYYGTSKLCGVLVENKFRGSKWDASVVGIGLNINQSEFPDELSQKATSLKQISNRNFNTKDILIYLINELKSGYFLINSNATKAIQSAYYSLLFGTSIFNRYYLVEEGREEDFIVHQVLPTGQIIMEDKNKNKFTFWFKEIELIKKAAH